MEFKKEIEKYPHLNHLLSAQLSIYPESTKFFERRFKASDDNDYNNLETIATHVSNLVGGREKQFSEDYAWLCSMQMEEELYFRRNGKYRLSTFAEALEQVYANKPYMTRYMNGLLMTQLWWANHTEVMRYYRESFLAGNRRGYSHLEIGPGHGLFIYLAATDPRSGKIEGWDISEASIDLTKEALRKLGLEKLPLLRLQDMFDSPTGSFDSVVFSEVLEHMEYPGEALKVLHNVLSKDGRIFINMPINSPAPDHLFNTETPEELVSFIENHGFKIEDTAFFPGTNQMLQQSRDKKLTINCVVVARRA